MPERDEATAFVLDASVLINFLGSGAAERLLKTLPGPALVADRAFQEVLRDPSGRIPPADIRQILAETGLVAVRSLGDTQPLYLELASALNPDRLDDGDAATVALALGCGATPVLDETKARRVYRSRFPDQPLERAMIIVSAILSDCRYLSKYKATDCRWKAPLNLVSWPER